MNSGKYRKRISQHGIFGAVRLAVGKSLSKRRKKKIFSLENAEDRFTEIFRSNHWNNPESRSGEGSTLENTANLRKGLPGLFERHGVTSVLDAPCGDFNWMKSVVQETGIGYCGGDIVKPLVEMNRSRHRLERVDFVHLDITSGTLPDAELMICRDCLFHLSYKDINRFFVNFLSADIPFLLTSTHDSFRLQAVLNRDIVTGDMRPIDLLSQPFGLSETDVVEAIDDTMKGSETERRMLLVRKPSVEKMSRNLAAFLARA